jgi:hypothetical protein
MILSIRTVAVAGRIGQVIAMEQRAGRCFTCPADDGMA